MEGSAIIEPQYFSQIAADTEEIPLVFSVMAKSGLQEIQIESHSGFDGHTHGRLALAANFQLLTHFEVVDEASIDNPTLFNSRKDDGLKIYLDERNPSLDKDDLILAGPYHFSIKATDVLGNETSYRDNSTYHTTLYIQRAYAPQVNITSLNATGRSVEGSIFKNETHQFSSDISFVWIYIEESNEQNPGQEGEVLAELIWGKSNWPHQFRENEGEALPDQEMLSVDELLDDKADFWGKLQSNKLVVWVEDKNGNITVKQFNN